MGKGNVLQTLIGLSAPAMLSMFFQNLYALADTIFVSWLGTTELAALSLCIPLLFIGMALSKGVAVGTTALMSHARGSGREDRTTQVAGALLPILAVVTAPLCLLAVPEINMVFFDRFGADAAVLAEVKKFMFWLALSFPVMAFAMTCEGVFLSYGDSKLPMKAMIAGNLLNLCLDPLLIFGCNMGIAGASLSSLLGWLCSGSIMWITLKRRNLDHPIFSLTPQKMKVWKDMLFMGGPVSLAMLVMPLSNAGLNFILTPFGPAFVGSWMLSANLEKMIVLPLYGLSCSLIPFAGFNLGAGNGQRIREGIKLAIKSCYMLLIPIGILFYLFAPQIIGLFKPGTEVMTLSSWAFRAALVGYWLMPVELIVIGLAQGIKRPQYTMFINATRLLLLRLPLAFIFARLWGGKAIYISHTASLLISGLISLFVLKRLLHLSDKGCQTSQQKTGRDTITTSTFSKQ